MLIPGSNVLALRIADMLRNQCTHETLPDVAKDLRFERARGSIHSLTQF